MLPLAAATRAVRRCQSRRAPGVRAEGVCVARVASGDGARDKGETKRWCRGRWRNSRLGFDTGRGVVCARLKIEVEVMMVGRSNA